MVVFRLLPCLIAAILCPFVLTSAIPKNTTYDFIIVGGGTSGLTVADRLTEDPSGKWVAEIHQKLDVDPPKFQYWLLSMDRSTITNLPFWYLDS